MPSITNLPSITIPVISDAEPTTSTQMETLNWYGLLSNAETYNANSVAAFATQAKNIETQATQGVQSPPLLALSWQTVSGAAFTKLWAELMPTPNAFNPSINIQDSVTVNVLYVQPTATLEITPAGALTITPATAPAAPPASPLGAPVANYPGLRYAIPGDANPDYFIFTAPDGTKWQRETVIMLGPIYQELP